MEPSLLGLTEAARQLDLSVNRLRFLVDVGEVACVKDHTGRRLLFASHVEQFKKKREAAAAAKKAKRAEKRPSELRRQADLARVKPINPQVLKPKLKRRPKP